VLQTGRLNPWQKRLGGGVAAVPGGSNPTRSQPPGNSVNSWVAEVGNVTTCFVTPSQYFFRKQVTISLYLKTG
jgi:hypothetical protein